MFVFVLFFKAKLGIIKSYYNNKACLCLFVSVQVA